MVLRSCPLNSGKITSAHDGSTASISARSSAVSSKPRPMMSCPCENVPFNVTLKGTFSQGQDIMGRGFELTAEERAEMLAVDPSCAEVIFPLFNGQDLNTMPRLEPYRWVIYFRDWPEAQARQYEAAFRRVEELV